MATEGVAQRDSISIDGRANNKKIENDAIVNFFKSNYDSTIIYSNLKSNYYIIAKEKNEVYFFTYLNPYKRAILGRSYPGGLEKHFVDEDLKFKTLQPDTNRYFLPYIIERKNKLKYWELISTYKIWELKDDKEIYKEVQKICDVEDGSTDTFYLITESSTKVLSYYEADFFEKCSKSDQNRQNAIKARDSFKNIFKN